MKHEQVVVDYWVMVKSSLMYLVLAASGFVLLRMVQTVFWLPGYLNKRQEKLDKMMQEMEAKEKEKDAFKNEIGFKLDEKKDK